MGRNRKLCKPSFGMKKYKKNKETKTSAEFTQIN